MNRPSCVLSSKNACVFVIRALRVYLVSLVLMEHKERLVKQELMDYQVL